VAQNLLTRSLLAPFTLVLGTVHYAEPCPCSEGRSTKPNGVAGVYRAPAVRMPPVSKLLHLNEKWDLQLEENEVSTLAWFAPVLYPVAKATYSL
jgi:hypothetical protein